VTHKADTSKEKKRMGMEIVFPGNKKVNAVYKGFTTETDQPKNEGGDGSAPEPYDLFLTAIGTCAGVYVVYFCDERGIDTSKIKMRLEFDRNEKKHLIETVHIHMDLPPEFPKKYKSAVVRTAELCTVKRNIVDPPKFLVTADIQE
jgi:ribosomal protein S12 methylthiotransferase accessory factor